LPLRRRAAAGDGRTASREASAGVAAAALAHKSNNTRRRTPRVLTKRSPPSLYAPCAPQQDGKCLYTTVREFVENSLDAAEAIGVLPEVSITMCAGVLFAHALLPCAAHAHAAIHHAPGAPWRARGRPDCAR
jgi:hypothetical protein